MFNLSRHAQSAEDVAGDVRNSLDNVHDSFADEEPSSTQEEIYDSFTEEDKKSTLNEVQIDTLIQAIQNYLDNPDYAEIRSAVETEPEMAELFMNRNPSLLEEKIKEMGLEGAAAQLRMPGNSVIPDDELKAYFNRMKAKYLGMQRRQEPAGVPGIPARGAFNLKNHKIAQEQEVLPTEPVAEESLEFFINKYLDDLLLYNGKGEQEDIVSEKAKNSIVAQASPLVENEVNDAVRSIQGLHPISERDKAARLLEYIFTSFVSKKGFERSQTEDTVMANKKPDRIIKFDLSDHILGYVDTSKMTKTATAFQSQEYVLYGPSEKRVCPKLTNKNVGGVVSEHTCRYHCLDGLVIDDNKTICGEALWRANAMDKFNAEYVDADGNIVGGYLNKRFEINRNVPEESKMRLKPGETRKPRPAEWGNTESRMQAMRKAEGEARGYRPDTNTGDPFTWCGDADQNNVEQTQQERNRREEAMGHQLVQYTNRDQGENNPKKAFNLKSHKTAQLGDNTPVVDTGKTIEPQKEEPKRDNHHSRITKKKAFNLKESQLSDPAEYNEPQGFDAGNDISGWTLSEVMEVVVDPMVQQKLSGFNPQMKLGQVWSQLDPNTQQVINFSLEEAQNRGDSFSQHAPTSPGLAGELGGQEDAFAANKSETKTAKEEGPFEYEGETYSTNPFATCNKNIKRKDDPDKWERCVQRVKEDSKVSFNLKAHKLAESKKKS